MTRKAETSVPIHPVLSERWSPRSLDEEATVTIEDLTAMLEAARWAPSANNVQPWRFIIARRGDENFTKIVATLAGFNKTWAPKASAFVVIVADMKHRDGSDRQISLYDSGLAAAHLSLEAHHRGYVVHQMAGFDKPLMKSEFTIADGFDPIVIMAIGTKAPLENLTDPALLERETAPRTRLAIADLIISGSI